MILGWFDPILGIGSRVTERNFIWLTLNSTSLSKMPCIFDKCWLRQEFSCFLHSQQYLFLGSFLGFLLFLTVVSCFFLKYGFCNKSFRKDEPLTSWTLLQHICPYFWAWLLNTIAKQICCQSVQLVRVSSFRNDFVAKSIL